jgi:mRNA interferase RelE/StbE
MREGEGSLESFFLLLKRNPILFRELDVVKLRGYENMYQIRVGDYRIVYEVLWTEQRIIIHYIGSRETVYRGRG